MKKYTVEGNPVSFETDVAQALKAFTIPFQSGGGITGLPAYTTGKNLFDASAVVRKDGYYIDTNGIETSSGASGYTLSHTPVSPSTQYTISGEIATGNQGWSVYFYDSTGVFRSRLSGRKGSELPYAFTTPDYCTEVAIQYNLKYRYNLSELQIELGSTATAFSPYVGNTYPVTFPAEAGSVTAGSFDAVTGVLTTTSPAAGSYQLTPITVETLVGANTIWTDTNGTNSITYLKSRT